MSINIRSGGMVFRRGGPGLLPISRVLCPTDFSDASQRAIHVARELAAYFEAELILLNVVVDVPTPPNEPVPTGFDIDGYMKELVVSSENLLEKIRDRIDDGDLKVRSVALRGNPSDRITMEALEENVDLIVISSHGKAGFDNLVFGSVIEKAIRLTQCPVLVVPAFPDYVQEPVGAEPTLARSENILEYQLEHLTEKLDAVEKGIEERKDTMDFIYRRRVAELDDKNEEVQRKLDRIKESSGEAWEEIKTGFSDLWQAFDRALSRFKERKAGPDDIWTSKRAYEQRLGDLLSEWGDRIDALKDQIDTTTVGSRDLYMSYIGDLKEKQRIASERLFDFRHCDPGTLTAMKKNLDKSIEDLGMAMQNAMQALRMKT